MAQVYDGSFIPAREVDLSAIIASVFTAGLELTNFRVLGKLPEITVRGTKDKMLLWMAEAVPGHNERELEEAWDTYVGGEWITQAEAA